MAKAGVQPVRVEISRTMVRLHLSRPDRYNVLDTATLASLAEALDPTHHRDLPLVLEGDGEVFSVGADIAELARFSADAAVVYSRLGQEVVAAIERWPGVTVARLNGYALGAGLELALGCDVLVAAGDIRLGLPGLAWALVPGMGGLRRLACRLSTEACSDLFLGGDVIDTERALSQGLVDRLITSSKGFSEFVEGLGDYSPSAVEAIRSLRLTRRGRIDRETEAEIFSQPFISGECQKRLRKLLAS
jgi:enoyl-CoA hydratase